MKTNGKMNGTAVDTSTDCDERVPCEDPPKTLPNMESTLRIMNPPRIPRIVRVTLDSTETKKRDGNMRIMKARMAHRINRLRPTSRDSMNDIFSPERANADGPIGSAIRNLLNFFILCTPMSS